MRLSSYLLSLCLVFLSFTCKGELFVSELENLVRELPAGSIYSIQVRDPVTGNVLFEEGADLNLVPASVLKVMTATLAYEALGDEFRYKTQLISQGRVNKGLVKGASTLVFSGDPSLQRGHLDDLVAQLRAQGVHTLSGDLWLDGEIFSGYDRAGGVSWDDLNICFAAPAAAMILDRNCFYGWLKPGKNKGDATYIEYDKPEWELFVDNQVRTQSDKNCTLEVKPDSDNEYRLEGCINANSRPVRLAFAVNNVERAVERYMLSALKKQGVTLKGRVIVGRPDLNMPNVLAEHESELISQLLKPVLEDSDNLYSDSILKTVAYKTSGKPGSYVSGIASARTLLGKNGIEFGSSRLVDGSGLSRYNFISASTLVDVLMFGWLRWGEESPWLNDRRRPGRWYKTGYMSGVSSMAGYVFQDQGRPLVFAIILNGLMPPLPASYDEMKDFRKDIRGFHRSFLNALAKAG